MFSLKHTTLLLVACQVVSVSGFTAPLARLPLARSASLAPACSSRVQVGGSLFGKSSLGLKMSSDVTETSETETGEYFGVDQEGNKVKLTLEAKEKKYLDACNAFYNDKKPILSDTEFNQLREDLSFAGSEVIMMTRIEILFMVAANRYAEGSPIMSDEEFDNMRKVLKQRNSPAVMHKVPTCRVETSTCKADMSVDGVKNNVLYIPIVAVVTVVWAELAYWLNTLSGTSLDPVVSLLLNSPFIFVISYIIKNFIVFQNPLVTKAACPQCYTEQNIFFGDILFCNGKTEDVVNTQCVNKACGCDLRASRSRMVVETDLPKNLVEA